MLQRTSESKDELVAALSYIETHPEEWNQEAWVCGSSACLGGRVALMTGRVMEWNPVVTREPRVRSSEFGTQPISVWLEKYFGLDSYPLWAASNDLQSLQIGVKAYCNDENVAEAIHSDWLERHAFPTMTKNALVVLALLVKSRACGHDESKWMAVWTLPDGKELIYSITSHSEPPSVVHTATSLQVICPECDGSWEVKELAEGVIEANVRT